jgi:outer membrane protein assembly factor BamB
MITPRYDAGATHLNNQIYIFSGSSNGDWNAVTDAEVYSIDEDRWESLPPVPTASYSVNAVVAEGAIYITGYAFTDVYRFDPDGQTYTGLQLNLPMADKGVITDGN